jgi:hypothetical protein
VGQAGTAFCSRAQAGVPMPGYGRTMESGGVGLRSVEAALHVPLLHVPQALPDPMQAYGRRVPTDGASDDRGKRQEREVEGQ